MTLTLEIPLEIERELTRAAASSGRALSEWIVEAAREKATPSEKETEDEAEARRLEAVDRACGMFAGHGRTVDEFLAERHAEGEAEYDKWVAGQKWHEERRKGEAT